MGNAPGGRAADAWSDALESAAGRLAAHDPEAVVFHEDREDLRADGDTTGVETTHTRTSGAAVRLVKPATTAFLSGARLDDLDALAEAARSTALPPAPAAERATLAAPRLDGRRAGRIVRALITAAMAERGGPEIEYVRATYVAVHQAIAVGRPGRHTATDVRRGERVRIEVGVRSRGHTARAVGERVLRPGREVRLEAFAREVAVRSAARLSAGVARPGSCPAVFAPGVGGILVHELVGHALEADVVLRGASRLAVESAPVAPVSLRIVDDPRRARVGWRVDDEGEAARAVSLIEGGRVAGRIHDRATARITSEGPTGHGRCASFRDPVLPRMGCTFVAAGSAQPEDVLDGVREGLYVRRMEAARADPSTGHAVFRVTDADRIVDGRISEPVAPFLFAITTPAALHALELVADDLDFDTCIGSCARDGQPLAISVGAPTCRLGLIKVLG